jgi:8-oxo-dGTP pyrophosphatase MutT (NUDIX family)
VVEDGRILMSHESGSGLWMIPGGGMEPGEDERDCCRREVAEETGYLVEPTACVLEITDYYRDLKHVNRYYLASVTGRTEQHLTEREEKAGMGPEWIPVEEAMEIFSYVDADASLLRKALYRREYAALTALFGEKSE